ncbi:MAG: hypothetical protein JRJ45_09490 [Deltaproteobacteria bacterium]|nr:hypothetical protein [Deltaproteobacteria bacterium]
MKIKIAVHENESPIEVTDITRLNEVIYSASEEARAEGLLSIIFLEAENGNNLSLVVGGNETVLGFNYGHKDPPYYASKGKEENEDPVLTAFVALHHHTEFPRNWVIPMKEGILALHEFFKTGELPGCIEWTDV